MSGDPTPLMVAKKFAIPKTLPAKFGDKSCAFDPLVRVLDPFKPRAIVIKIMHICGSSSMKQKPSKMRPGIMCAVYVYKYIIKRGTLLVT